MLYSSEGTEVRGLGHRTSCNASATLQALFAETLLLGCVVAVVGGFISPVGTYLVKRAAGMLSPKAALISSLGQWTAGQAFLLAIQHREEGCDEPPTNVLSACDEATTCRCV